MFHAMPGRQNYVRVEVWDAQLISGSDVRLYSRISEPRMSRHHPCFVIFWDIGRGAWYKIPYSPSDCRLVSSDLTRAGRTHGLTAPGAVLTFVPWSPSPID